MKRRTALAAAGAVALSLVAGSVAVAANLGLMNARSADPVGDLTPVSDASANPKVVTVYVDEPSAPSTQPAEQPVAPQTYSDGYFDDDGYEEYEDDDHEGYEGYEDDDHGEYEDDDHGEREEHEYEGRDDDD